MEIQTSEIKRLRDITGSSIALCKQALEGTGGDMEKALDVLKISSREIAEKKVSRSTGAGMIESYIHGSGRVGVLVELRSETDFVAKNESFRILAHNIALQIASMNPEDVLSLLSQPFVKDSSITIEELIKQNSGNFGEKIEVARFSRFEL